jgi:hypothetical protein
MDGCGSGKISECLQTIEPQRVARVINNLLKENG